MDYKEFNKEYKKYEMWNDQMDFDEVTGNLLWGKQNGIPQLKLTDEWTGQEDVVAAGGGGEHEVQTCKTFSQFLR